MNTFKLSNFDIQPFEKHDANKGAGYMIGFDFEYNGGVGHSHVISYIDSSNNNKSGFDESTLECIESISRYIMEFNKIGSDLQEVNSLNLKCGISNPAKFMIFDKLRSADWS